MNEWPPSRNYPPPAISSRWQTELNRLAGFAYNGMPHLRFEWGCTTPWTPYVRELKYLHRRDTVHAGWTVDFFDNSGNRIQTKRYGLRANLPKPSTTVGMPVAVMETIEIGIPRWWITQYIPPSLVGPWEEARQRIIAKIGHHANMGPRPEGIYYLGFHGLWHHEGRQCCENAAKDRRKCFGYYREPSDLDILYVTSLWKEMGAENMGHSWMEPADDRGMKRVLNQLNEKREAKERKEREDMKLRIRDAFKSHKGRLTSRKGKDTFIFSHQDKIMPGTEVTKGKNEKITEGGIIILS